MKTVFAEATTKAVDHLCQPWHRLADRIWLQRGRVVNDDLCLDPGLQRPERILAETAASLFDPESTVALREVCALDDDDFDRFLTALKIIRRTADLADIQPGDWVRTLSYRKILDLARRQGLKPAPFEDIYFPKVPFYRELIPYCGDDLLVTDTRRDGYIELKCGDETWEWPLEWIAGKA